MLITLLEIRGEFLTKPYIGQGTWLYFQYFPTVQVQQHPVTRNVEIHCD